MCESYVELYGELYFHEFSGRKKGLKFYFGEESPKKSQFRRFLPKFYDFQNPQGHRVSF